MTKNRLSPERLSELQSYPTFTAYGSHSLDTDLKAALAELAERRAAEPKGDPAKRCQHDLLLPASTVLVHEDGYGGTCSVCLKDWRTRVAEPTDCWGFPVRHKPECPRMTAAGDPPCTCGAVNRGAGQ